jgi:protein-serine/threonine kinase
MDQNLRMLRVRIPSAASSTISDHRLSDDEDEDGDERLVVDDEIVCLPSPSLSASGGNVFKYYNGHSPPPAAAISRAPSLRVPSGSEAKAATTTLPLRTTAPEQQLIIPKQRCASSASSAGSSQTTSASSSPEETAATTASPGDGPAPPTSGRVYEAYDAGMRKSTWREVRLLGRGAFSRVLLAIPNSRYVYPEYRQRCEALAVAVKIIDMGAADDPSRHRIEEGLRREIEIIQSLRHPSIIRLFAFNTDPRRALMVLPYCAGGDLFQFAAEHGQRLSAGLIQRVFAEVAMATAYLHTRNLVHRDIKLENVLLALPAAELLNLDRPQTYPHPLVTLTDFGLSRKINPETPELTTRCGSEDYVSPELVMGQPYDGRETDTWAMGVVLYCLLEGRLPFDPPKTQTGGRTSSRTVHRIARVDWAWYDMKTVSDDDAQWTGAMDVVQHCLKRKNRRWTSAQVAEHPWVRAGLQVDLHPGDTDLVKQIFKP